MIRRALSVGLILLAVTTRTSAQTHAPDSRAELAASLAGWRAQHGESWQTAIDADTGAFEMLYGGRAAAKVAPRGDAEFIALARQWLDATRALHRVDAATLVAQRALFLPLGQVGCRDKETVRFREEIDGVRVVGGFVNVLMNARGDLLSVQSTALPSLSGFATSARVTGARASAFARAAFARATGLEPTRESAAELVIDPMLAQSAGLAQGAARVGRLAWEIDLQRHDATQSGASTPIGFTYWIDAQTGDVLDQQESVLSFDVTGTVTSMATPGLLPDIAGNPDTAQNMRFMQVTSSAGTTTTDANGNFAFPGVNTPLACTFTYAGDFNAITDDYGAAYSLTTTLQPNQPNTITMNPGAQASITSQANAFRVVDLMRDFVRSINPSDATADFVATSNCNLQQTCNAYYDGFSINFFAAGGGCVNTAYSTVISHEHGHWMNVLYGTGNGGDGMGEGNADVWSMYIHDTPIIGADFAGSGFIRTGNNTSPFCGDCCPSCHGEVHADGEPWMGAAWKIRNRLDVSNGNALGDLIADNIFLGWMNAYNQTKIKSIIEVQWLTLDDDDGNIYDGTPHFADIDGGFRDQSFPGVTLPLLSVGPVAAPSTTTDQVGPYSVSARITSNVGLPIATATLSYRVNGGAFIDVAMASLGNGMYAAAVPGQLAPSHVELYVSGTDSAAHAGVSPAGAPASLYDFDVGVVHIVRADDFEAGAAGWMHGATSGTDDWQLGFPVGKSGTAGGIPWSDPVGAYSGTFCFATQLGNGASSGAYSPSSSSWLRSPVIDCSGSVGTKLRFRRWLTLEANDQAAIRVNGTTVYASPTANVLDASWTNQEIDISALADHNASVQLEWDLQSDGSTQLGGWNVDTVQILWVSVPCPPAAHFCTAAANSHAASGATMSFQGSTLVSQNDLELIAFDAPPLKTALFFYGQNAIAPVAFGNGFRCIANPFFRLPAIETSVFGDALFLLDLNALPAGGQISAGEVWNFQLWYRDPAGGGANYNSSDALGLTFCP